MGLKYLLDQDSWMLGEDIPNCDLFFSTIWLHGFVNYFDQHTGAVYKKILCKFEGYHLWFYFGEKDSYDVAEHIANRMISEDGYMAEVNRNIVLESDKLSAFSATIPQEQLGELSVDELWRIYETHQKIHEHYYAWGWIPVGVDMFHNNLTRRVKEYLVSIGVSSEKLNEFFVILTQPTEKSLILIEQEELLSIAIAMEEGNETPDNYGESVKKMIDSHHKKYYYTKHLWVSGEYTIEDYVQQLKDIFATGESPKRIMERQRQEFERARIEREMLMDKLKIEARWQKIFDEFGRFMVTKIYRRYAQLLAVHHMSAILREISRRGFITEKQVRFMRPNEVKALLLQGVCDSEELLRRVEYCVYYAEKDGEKIILGDEARQYMSTVEKIVDTSVSELKGETGCVGYAKGKVKIIIRAEDMSKMETGDILVSIATDPDIVPAMKKAAGIITEQGGVTSHAAIVSRELGIPCVIGTKIATKVLKDGDMVEVDANKGVVRKI